MFQVQQILHDRYQLVQQKGQTPGRQTWLATDLSRPESSLVIVKLLAFADQVNWDTLKLFEREAKVLRQVDHPQIPKYRDCFSIDDRVVWFALVQEFIPGTSLKDLLAQGQRFSERGICQIAAEVLQILVYLHSLNPPVFHRDIKPSNLIWGEDQHIHLIDFGAVQDKAAVEGATFTVVGTYGYAPLEQFGGRTVPSSDLYALGATLIHLLTGVSPSTLPQHNLRIQFADKTSIRPGLVHWIEKLTEPDVARRFSTARVALDSLQMVMQASTSSPTSVSTPTSHAVPSKAKGISLSQKLVFLTGGIVCLMVAIATELTQIYPVVPYSSPSPYRSPVSSSRQVPQPTPNPQVTPTPRFTPNPQVTPTPRFTPTPLSSPTPRFTPTPLSSPTLQQSNPQAVFIVNSLSPNRCLDVSGFPGTAVGTPLILGDCETSGFDSYNGSPTDQKWVLRRDGFIQNEYSGKCIDVSGTPGTQNGIPLILGNCETSGFNQNNGSPTDQRWVLRKDGFIQNEYSGKCIDVSGAPGTTNGSPILLWDCSFSNAPFTDDEQWHLQ